ncbi:hypothetical protein HDU76_005384 [Blyttiomyces sp. JEL0837]|nr:hypothetical protein HDU76_005384 [Blyttiomyces sp. JEL0837]
MSIMKLFPNAPGALDRPSTAVPELRKRGSIQQIEAGNARTMSILSMDVPMNGRPTMSIYSASGDRGGFLLEAPNVNMSQQRLDAGMGRRLSAMSTASAQPRPLLEEEDDLLESQIDGTPAEEPTKKRMFRGSAYRAQAAQLTMERKELLKQPPPASHRYELDPEAIAEANRTLIKKIRSKSATNACVRSARVSAKKNRVSRVHTYINPAVAAVFHSESAFREFQERYHRPIQTLDPKDEETAEALHSLANQRLYSKKMMLQQAQKNRERTLTFCLGPEMTGQYLSIPISLDSITVPGAAGKSNTFLQLLQHNSQLPPSSSDENEVNQIEDFDITNMSTIHSGRASVSSPTPGHVPMAAHPSAIHDGVNSASRRLSTPKGGYQGTGLQSKASAPASAGGHSNSRPSTAGELLAMELATAKMATGRRGQALMLQNGQIKKNEEASAVGPNVVTGAANSHDQSHQETTSVFQEAMKSQSRAASAGQRHGSGSAGGRRGSGRRRKSSVSSLSSHAPSATNSVHHRRQSSAASSDIPPQSLATTDNGISASVTRRGSMMGSLMETVRPGSSASAASPMTGDATGRRRSLVSGSSDTKQSSEITNLLPKSILRQAQETLENQLQSTMQSIDTSSKAPAQSQSHETPDMLSQIYPRTRGSHSAPPIKSTLQTLQISEEESQEDITSSSPSGRPSTTGRPSSTSGRPSSTNGRLSPSNRPSSGQSPPRSAMAKGGIGGDAVDGNVSGSISRSLRIGSAGRVTFAKRHEGHDRPENDDAGLERHSLSGNSPMREESQIAEISGQESHVAGATLDEGLAEIVDKDVIGDGDSVQRQHEERRQDLQDEHEHEHEHDDIYSYRDATRYQDQNEDSGFDEYDDNYENDTDGNGSSTTSDDWQSQPPQPTSYKQAFARNISYNYNKRLGAMSAATGYADPKIPRPAQRSWQPLGFDAVTEFNKVIIPTILKPVIPAEVDIPTKEEFALPKVMRVWCANIDIE